MNYYGRLIKYIFEEIQKRNSKVALIQKKISFYEEEIQVKYIISNISLNNILVRTIK